MMKRKSNATLLILAVILFACLSVNARALGISTPTLASHYDANGLTTVTLYTATAVTTTSLTTPTLTSLQAIFSTTDYVSFTTYQDTINANDSLTSVAQRSAISTMLSLMCLKHNNNLELTGDLEKVEAKLKRAINTVE